MPTAEPGAAAELRERARVLLRRADHWPGWNRFLYGKRKPPRRWILIALIGLLLAYPVVGTVFIWSGLFEKVMRSEDLRIDLAKPAWTFWPGRIHVQGARILVNGETQFSVEAKHLLFDTRLLELVHKHLHIVRLKGDDLRYRMRVQVETDKGIKQRLAAYPPLPDLPGDPTLIKGKAEQTEERQSDFTVEVEGIDAHIAELWFMEYHYVGPGTIKGGFLVGPNRMRVDTSVQDFGPGELRFGEGQLIARNFGGRIEAQIADINPEEHADEGFLELVTSNIDLKGDVETLKHVSAYTNGIQVLGGAGPFSAKLLLSKGRLNDASRISYSTEKVGVRGDRWGVDTDFAVVGRVGTQSHAENGQKKAIAAGKPVDDDKPAAEHAKTDDAVLPRIRATSKSTYVSFANYKGEVFTVQLHDHDHQIVLASNALGRMTDIDHAYIRFPNIYTRDMDDLAGLGKGGGPVKSRAGEATGSLVLDIDKKHVARGAVNAKFDGLSVSTSGINVQAEGSAGAQIQSNLDEETTTLTDTFVALSKVGMQAGDEKVEGWWMRFHSPYFAAWGLPPRRIESRVVLRAKSAEPFLKALAAKDEIAGIIPALTNLNNLRVNADFRKNDDVTDVTLEPVENSLFDVAGRYYAKGDDSKMAIVVGGKAISLGIATDKSGTSLMPFAREGWLNEKLKAFPRPREKIRSSQP